MGKKTRDEKTLPTGRLKLKVELVPKPLWQRNLRSREGVGKKRWDKLRRELIKEHGAHCAICGATESTLEGHELWDYRENEAAGTAVLLGIEIVCADCHDIHHWGRINKLLLAGDITAERYNHLRKHFRQVNRCRQEVFDRHYSQSLRLWEARSNKVWEIDWGPFKSSVVVAETARDEWAEHNLDHGDYFNITPGHHMPDRCPNCRAIGTLTPMNAEAELDQMSEGEEADYEAGVWGYAFCRSCQQTIVWGI